MKLNPDCIRDILLFLEESIRYTENSIAIKHNILDSMIQNFK